MTAKQSQESFLFASLEAAIAKYGAESTYLKRWTFGLKIALLFLSASSTVLLGLNVTPGSEYTVLSRNIALVIGAFSTFIVGLSAFWNIEAYWLKQKVLFARVRALRERLSFMQAKAGSLTAEQIEDGFLEYRGLMDDRIEYWERQSTIALPKIAAPDGKYKEPAQ